MRNGVFEEDNDAESEVDRILEETNEYEFSGHLKSGSPFRRD